MASKVNTRFVVILSVVLVVAAGAVLGLLYSVMYKSAPELAASGDKLMAAGEYEAAARQYSKAVNKEQTNAEWLRKWRDALLRLTPETTTDYEARYDKEYMQTLRQIALIETDSLQAQHDYLGAWLRQFGDTNAGRGSWEFLAGEARGSIARAEADPAVSKDPRRDALKRYRAIPRLRIYLSGLDMTAAELDEAIADAGAALEADPTDYETAFLLSHTHLQASSAAARRGEAAAESAAFTSATEVAQAFARSSPEHPGGALLELGLELEALRRSVVGEGGSRPETRGRVEAATEMMRPRLARVAELVKARGAEVFDTTLLARFQQVESYVDERGQTPLSLDMARWALEHAPQSSEYLLAVAGILGESGQYTEAIPFLERQVNLAHVSLSWTGLKQRYQTPQAMAMAADFLLRRADSAEDQAERAAALDECKTWRDRLAQRVAADHPPLLLVDGGLKALRGDWMDAKQLLTQYNSVTNNADAEGLLRLAAVHMRVNEPGEARRRLQQSLDRRPDSPRALFMLAELELQLRNFEAATTIYERIAKLDPENKGAASRLAEINAALGKGQSDDPVLRDVIAAARKADGLDGTPGDLDGAIRDLQAAAVAHSHDMRVVSELIRRLLEKRDRAGAVAAVRAAQAARPDDAELRAIEAALAETDPVKAQAALIANSAASDLDKNRALFELYARNRRNEEAEAILTEVIRVAPDEPWVLEMSFMRALAAKDYAKADGLAAKAAEKNLDRVGGRTFRARIRGAQGAWNDAITLLREGLEPGAATPEYWRLLGRTQVAAGRTSESIESFQRAVAMRPSDIILTKDLITVLMQQDRRSDALTAARAAERYAGSDLEFFEMLMVLEQTAGDKARVVQLRERYRVRDPDHRSNLLGLASVYLDLRQSDKARSVIDGLRRDADGIDAVALDARWHADRADYASARRIFAEYISALPDEHRTAEPYMTYATFMYSINDVQTAYVALLQARKYQSPLMEGDKGLGDFLVQNGRWDEAIAPFERIVNAKADDEVLTYTKRLIESCVRGGRAAEAQTLLDRMGPAGVEKDVVFLLLTSEVSAANGDAARQRAIIDRAIELFPAEPIAYLKRAQLARGKPDLVPEAINDLSAALRIQPNHWPALRLRADLYLSQQKWDEAFTDLRAAVRSNQRLDDLRGQLMEALMDRGRLNEAADVADESLLARPNDLALMIEVGDRFAAMRHWAQSVKYYRQAWEQTRNPIAAQKLLDGLLLQAPPLLAEAEAILRQVGADVERNPGLVIARAKLAAARGRMPDAKKDITTSLRLIRNTEVDAMSAWLAETRRIVTDQADLLRFYEQLQDSTPSHGSWMQLFRATVMSQDGSDKSNPSKAIALIETSLSGAEPPVVRRLMLALQSNTLYYMGQYPRVVEVCRRGLEEFTSDGEMMNNLAFTLAKHMGKPDEALPLARAAVEGSPESAEALDTLGYTQLRLGLLDEAEATLFQALQASRSIAARFAATLHQSMVYAQKKDRERAESLLKEVERMIAQYSFLDSEETRSDLAQLRKDIGGI